MRWKLSGADIARALAQAPGGVNRVDRRARLGSTAGMRCGRWIGALALLVAGCAPQPMVDADPALWVVRDADTTIYLFGTVHALKPGLAWFDEGVKAAFDASDELVLELVLPGDAETSRIAAELGTSSMRLPRLISPAENQRMRAALKQYGLAPDSLDRNDPWLAATMLASLPLGKLGYRGEDGAEAVLRAAAEKAGKRLTGLETLRQQLGFFDALPLPAQRRLLVETIDGLPETQAKIEATVTAWGKADTDGLARVVNADLGDAPEVAEALLVRRNRAWAAWVKRRMARPGTVFVAVGAGHLAGGRSLQAELAAGGFKVERVAY